MSQPTAESRAGSRWLRRVLRPGVLAPALLVAASLFFSLASLDRSSYWLDFDTPTQPVEALELSTGCWDYASGKPGVILTLTLAYLLVGPSPIVETMILAGLAALTTLAVYLLARRLSGSRALAAAAGLAWLALPAQMYYSRTHMGYPVAWFTLGVLAYTARRWRWAGLLFALAVMGHGAFGVPVGIFVVAALLTGSRPAGHRGWLEFVGFAALPWLFFEALSYAYTGVPLEWTLGTIRWYFFYQGIPAPTTWLHIWESVRLANGTIITVLLACSALYPWVRARRGRADWPLYITAWAMLLLYSARAGLTHARFIPRAISGVYPLLTVLAVVTLGVLAKRALRRGPRLLQSAFTRGALAGAAAVIVFAALVGNLLAAREFAQTAYPAVEAAFREAAQAGQPVRYYGNQWVGLYFAKVYGVEAAIDDPDVEVASANTQAMLIFEDNSAGMRDNLAARRGLYDIASVSHRHTNIWPAGVETEAATEELPQVRQGYQSGPVVGQLEIWRPISREGTFTARDDVGTHIHHYTGSGCIVPPRYGFGTQHWYQLVLQRLGERLGLGA